MGKIFTNIIWFFPFLLVAFPLSAGIYLKLGSWDRLYQTYYAPLQGSGVYSVSCNCRMSSFCAFLNFYSSFSIRPLCIAQFCRVWYVCNIFIQFHSIDFACLQYFVWSAKSHMQIVHVVSVVWSFVLRVSLG